nr:EAL domain-containing protein [Mitsuokella multacida]
MGAWLVLCVGYVVRMYASPYLVMNSFYMLAILIQYFAFQNPDIFLDRKTGALSHLTATPYLQELNERGPFSAFDIGINDYMESCSLYGERQMTKGLRAITRYLKAVFPDCQVIYAAMGRFVLLSTKETPFTKVHEEVNARMQAPWVDKHAHLYLTASYAMFQGQLKRREGIDLFFDYTATALHRAEEQHDVIVMEQSLFDQARLNTTVWRAIDRAIETNAVEIYFQPLYGTQQRRIIGAEVLARLHDKELGFIRPDIFITVAERSGSITQLGEQVFEKACLNLNLSPIQCRDSHMAEHLCCIAQRHKVPIHSFRFEITESALSYEQRLQQNMDMLIAQGAVLSLDDFGTGYSNLMRVLKFPFEDVKLDMSFVRAYFDQTNKLLPAIIEGFQSFGVQITAEGIENKQMADTLTTFGCRILQGFYFAKPLPMDEFLHYLKTTKPKVGSYTN